MAAYGAESVTKALFTYRPNGARNLFLCLRADRQQEAFDAYLMSGVRRILYGLVGKNADMPSYYDYVRDIRDGSRTARKRDTRNSQQILDDLLKGLRGE